MSIGQESPGGKSIRQILHKLYMAGVPVVAAAGNDREAGVSADTIWPCKMNSICVGAINKQYEQDSYSNIGGNVTVFAPGTDIITIDTGDRTITKSGTSFAAPLVAGVLATFLGWESLGHEGPSNPNLIRSRLDANLLRGILTDKVNGPDLGQSQNNLVTSGINYPGKPDFDPYNGVGEGIDNTYQMVSHTKTSGSLYGPFHPRRPSFVVSELGQINAVCRIIICSRLQQPQGISPYTHSRQKIPSQPR
jgi:subtilisin family serine protease